MHLSLAATHLYTSLFFIAFHVYLLLKAIYYIWLLCNIQNIDCTYNLYKVN